MDETAPTAVRPDLEALARVLQERLERKEML